MEKTAVFFNVIMAAPLRSKCVIVRAPLKWVRAYLWGLYLRNAWTRMKKIKIPHLLVGSVSPALPKQQLVIEPNI